MYIYIENRRKKLNYSIFLYIKSYIWIILNVLTKNIVLYTYLLF